MSTDMSSTKPYDQIRMTVTRKADAEDGRFQYESTRVVMWFIAYRGQIYYHAKGYLTKREAYKELQALKCVIWNIYNGSPRSYRKYALGSTIKLCQDYQLKSRLM